MKLLSIFLITFSAFAFEKIPVDELKLGSTSTATKTFEFLISSNPNVFMHVDGSSGNKLTLTADTFLVGDHGDDDKLLLFDNGFDIADMIGLKYDSTSSITGIRDSDFFVGKGVDEDIEFAVDIGLGRVSWPAIRYNSTSDEWEATVDGASYESITAVGGGGGASLTQSSFAATNDQSTAADVTGLSFSGQRGGHVILAAQLDATDDFANLCTLDAIDNNGTFILSSECTGSSELNVTFSIVPGTGQVQYTSDNYPGFVSLDMYWKEILIDL